MKRKSNVKRMLTRVRKRKRLTGNGTARFKQKETLLRDIKSLELNKTDWYTDFPLFRAKKYDPL